MLSMIGSLYLFAIAGSLTPGPNNMISLASGAAFGYRRTLPQILGVTIGFPLMVIAIGIGLAQVFVAVPALHTALKVVGALYLLWLAWKIAGAGGADGIGGMARPPRFIESALFQWVNPKAWTLALGVIPAFTTIGGETLHEVLLIAAVFATVSIPSLSVWALFGIGLTRMLSNDRQRRIVNLIMAGLVAASVVLLFV